MAYDPLDHEEVLNEIHTKSRKLRISPSTSPCHCPKGCVPWFMAIGARYMGAPAIKASMAYVIAAVGSQRKAAPSLLPHLIYDGKPTNITAWLQGQGVEVIFHRLSFIDKLREAGLGHNPIVGAYLRLDLTVNDTGPLGAHLRGEKSRCQSTVSYKQVLYTDSDVLFLGGIGQQNLIRPRKGGLFAMGSEAVRGSAPSNSGVMVMDVERFSQKRDALLRFGVEHKFHFPALDQGLLLKFFEGSIDKLPDEWNWKAYWGWQKKKKTNIRIAHFHGPKPRGVYGWYCLCKYKAYSPGVYSEYKDPCEQEAKETTGNMTLTPAQERGQRRRFKAYKELLDQSLSADGGALAFYLLLVWTNYLRLSGQYPSDPRLGSDQAMLRSCLLNTKMDRWPPGLRDELAAHLLKDEELWDSLAKAVPVSSDL